MAFLLGLDEVLLGRFSSDPGDKHNNGEERFVNMEAPDFEGDGMIISHSNNNIKSFSTLSLSSRSPSTLSASSKDLLEEMLMSPQMPAPAEHLSNSVHNPDSSTGDVIDKNAEVAEDSKSIRSLAQELDSVSCSNVDNNIPSSSSQSLVSSISTSDASPKKSNLRIVNLPSVSSPSRTGSRSSSSSAPSFNVLVFDPPVSVQGIIDAIETQIESIEINKISLPLPPTVSPVLFSPKKNNPILKHITSTTPTTPTPPPTPPFFPATESIPNPSSPNTKAVPQSVKEKIIGNDQPISLAGAGGANGGWLFGPMHFKSNSVPIDENTFSNSLSANIKNDDDDDDDEPNETWHEINQSSESLHAQKQNNSLLSPLEMQLENKKLKESRDLLAQSIESLGVEKIALSNQLQQSQMHMNAMQKVMNENISKLKDEVDTLQWQLFDKTQDLTQENKNNRFLTTEKEVILKNINDLKAELYKKEEFMKVSMKEWQDEKQELQLALSETTVELTQGITLLQQSLHHLENENGALKLQLEVTKREIEDIKASYLDKEKEGDMENQKKTEYISQLEDNKSSLQSRVDDMLTEIEKLKRANRTMKVRSSDKVEITPPSVSPIQQQQIPDDYPSSSSLKLPEERGFFVQSEPTVVTRTLHTVQKEKRDKERAILVERLKKAEAMLKEGQELHASISSPMSNKLRRVVDLPPVSTNLQFIPIKNSNSLSTSPQLLPEVEAKGNREHANSAAKEYKNNNSYSSKSSSPSIVMEDNEDIDNMISLSQSRELIRLQRESEKSYDDERSGVEVNIGEVNDNHNDDDGDDDNHNDDDGDDDNHNEDDEFGATPDSNGATCQGGMLNIFFGVAFNDNSPDTTTATTTIMDVDANAEADVMDEVLPDADIVPVEIVDVLTH